MFDPSKRVFIATTSPAASGALQEMLTARGLVPMTLEQNSVPGTTSVDSLQRCVNDADIVVGLLDDPMKNAEVFFELGIATAFNKPTLLVISPEYPVDALPMSGIPYLRANTKNVDSIVFGVEQVLSVAPQRVTWEPAIRGKPLGEAADDFLNILPQVNNGGDFENLIYDVLKATRTGTVARGSEAEHKGVDFAVWSSDLEPTIGNPLLIECKQSLTTSSAIDEAIGRMLRSVSVIRNGYGLVIFQHADQRMSKDLSRSFPFMFIAAEDFINGLRTNDFATLVRELRNASVHRK